MTVGDERRQPLVPGGLCHPGEHLPVKRVPCGRQVQVPQIDQQEQSAPGAPAEGSRGLLPERGERLGTRVVARTGQVEAVVAPRVGETDGS
ncbi:hypothetical protein [Streptomyces massasporeus]|uniref:hypothetical protein n=1 Tax=Streptomyces massasporeus TaxID=67324 RepID=UPI001676997E|nr:hypothetical protein [Streptomyces massasporeus]